MNSKPPVESTPLARLFAIAYRDLLEDLHERIRARGWLDVRPSYGYVLLAARDEHTSVTALAGLMGVSKQAASKLVDTMVAAGYISRDSADGDKRWRPVRLTPRGHALLAAVEEVYDELEADWARLVGPSDLENIRSVLVTVLTARHGGLPPIRPAW